MTADMTDDLSPIEAVQTLTEIEGYDEKLTARAFGLNLMVCFVLSVSTVVDVNFLDQVRNMRLKYYLDDVI